MSRFQMHVFVRHKKWGIKISNHNSHIVNIIPYKFIDGINVRAQKWLEEAKIGSVSYPKSTHETWNKTNTWICPLHYGHFWKILSQNCGINFYSYGLIFILFLKILASRAQKSVDHLPSFKIFEIEAKLPL